MGILKEIMSWIIITLTVVQSSTCKHFPSSSFPTCRTLVFRECETWLWLLIHSENRDLNFFWFCVVSALPPFLVCLFCLYGRRTIGATTTTTVTMSVLIHSCYYKFLTTMILLIPRHRDNEFLGYTLHQRYFELKKNIYKK